MLEQNVNAARSSPVVQGRADGRQLSWHGLNDLICTNMSAMSDAVKETPSTSYFEAFTALAIQHFAESKVDWAIMEAGLGGVTDATNVFRPDQVVPSRSDQFQLI